MGKTANVARGYTERVKEAIHRREEERASEEEEEEEGGVEGVGGGRDAEGGGKGGDEDVDVDVDVDIDIDIDVDSYASPPGSGSSFGSPPGGNPFPTGAAGSGGGGGGRTIADLNLLDELLDDMVSDVGKGWKARVNAAKYERSIGEKYGIFKVGLFFFFGFFGFFMETDRVDGMGWDGCF